MEKHKINNVAAITGGCTIVTCDGQGSDEFSDANTTGSSMAYGGYSDIKGDTCHGLVVAPTTTTKAK